MTGMIDLTGQNGPAAGDETQFLYDYGAEYGARLAALDADSLVQMVLEIADSYLEPDEMEEMVSEHEGGSAEVPEEMFAVDEG